MFITATIQTTVSGIPTYGRQVDDAEEREREVVDPGAERARDRGGRDLAGELRDRVEPAEVVDRADDARDRGAEHDAPHLAVEREERERRHEDPEEDREAAEPRDRALVDVAAAGLGDDAEEARHATDGRCQEHDHDEGDQGAPENLGVRAELFEHATWRLLRAVEAVACVSEAGDDVPLLVELAVDRGDDDREVRMVAEDPLDPLRRRDQRDQAD